MRLNAREKMSVAVVLIELSVVRWKNACQCCASAFACLWNDRATFDKCFAKMYACAGMRAVYICARNEDGCMRVRACVNESRLICLCVPA